MWETLLKRYWRVSIFKDTPENTPYSAFLLVLAAFVFFILILLQWSIADIKQQFRFSTSVFAALSLVASYFAYSFLLLTCYNKASRMVQTLTSLLASHVLIHFFAVPLLLITPLLMSTEPGQPGTLALSILYVILTLVLTAWQFLVTAHIYKSALDLEYFAAVLASFGLLACNILTVSFWQ